MFSKSSNYCIMFSDSFQWSVWQCRIEFWIQAWAPSSDPLVFFFFYLLCGISWVYFWFTCGLNFGCFCIQINQLIPLQRKFKDLKAQLELASYDLSLSQSRAEQNEHHKVVHLTLFSNIFIRWTVVFLFPWHFVTSCMAFSISPSNIILLMLVTSLTFVVLPVAWWTCKKDRAGAWRSKIRCWREKTCLWKLSGQSVMSWKVNSWPCW